MPVRAYVPVLARARRLRRSARTRVLLLLLYAAAASFVLDRDPVVPVGSILGSTYY